MDLLGRKGEEASEELDRMTRRLSRLESHLDAVDSALSDLMDNYEAVMEQEQEINRRELGKIEDAFEDIEREKDQSRHLRERLDEVEKRQLGLESRFEELVSSDLLETVSDIRDELRRVTRKMSELEELEDRINELENELVLEVNRRDFDFEQKLDRREYEDRESQIYSEIKKLRASVNVLAEELDTKDRIEVE